MHIGFEHKENRVDYKKKLKESNHLDQFGENPTACRQ